MTAPFLVSKQDLYALAEAIITSMVLVLGLRYLKEIIAFVLLELHHVFIRNGALPI